MCIVHCIPRDELAPDSPFVADSTVNKRFDGLCQLETPVNNMEQACWTGQRRFHILITLILALCVTGQVAAKLKHLHCRSLELQSSTSTVLANEKECGTFCAQVTASLGKSVQLENFNHTYVPDACQKDGGTCQYETVQWDATHKSCYCEQSLIMVRVSKADVRLQDGTIVSCNPKDITDRLYKSVGDKLPGDLQLKVTRPDVHCLNQPRDEPHAPKPCRCNEFGEVKEECKW
ncbi:hypothetical protein BCR37DRAFT_115429 [Protomyces lactucae-debilis]|uniref:Uncharacterized protein n=1 Tax=Protomyces lactucae-debilis TaxID=2754530 RepID=A0A1Y2F4D3_PROLT|nr:uncharacterized protein BCR37DRAFT_115429 [Protomyces lactucae-debilis]ORY78186.1 hypothetical protein BCR37DRAFT_115429 [Protomyces lactucae-debilis]